MLQHQQNRPIVLSRPNPLVVGQYSQSVSPFAYPPGPYAMAQASHPNNTSDNMSTKTTDQTTDSMNNNMNNAGTTNRHHAGGTTNIHSNTTNNVTTTQKITKTTNKTTNKSTSGWDKKCKGWGLRLLINQYVFLTVERAEPRTCVAIPFHQFLVL
jgi:hypothetical protein